MIKGFIIEDDFVWVKDLNKKTYRICFESTDKGRWYEASNSGGAVLDIIKETFFCGKETFFKVLDAVSNRVFESKYGRFFDDFSLFLKGPNAELMGKISYFNRFFSRKKILEKKGVVEELEWMPELNYLISNCELIFVFELNLNYGSNIIFFESAYVDAKDYVGSYFKAKGIYIEDLTNQKS